ncbi:hypothetical protein DACRYDRAFT_20303 [Dacryopinax primogenitus]|uniref:Translocon-associated protein subunit alpha n=1 Tax=Dacryopinax primogenitus (strain DJM 731) TaxID=1858805 RepID=M5GFZ8_DACPD|nr:uncharacterized protein DACRYDRAFT_20303 [Dacryopinax primogenitus]EJU04613.1 hypothetical protein DACRYDRAFT_20303 [Dacryopinax primogenitus]
MRPSFVQRALLALGLATFVTAAVVPSEPNVKATATWPEGNPFGLVVNGQKNEMSVAVENASPNNISLVSIGGSFHDAVSEAFLRNTTARSVAGVIVPSGAKLQLPYVFHSEFKPKDLKLHVWLDYLDGENESRATAFEGIVTITEPPSSIFDLQMWGTYLLLLALVAGGGYWAYQSYFPQKKRGSRSSSKPKPKPADVSSPVGTVKVSSGGGTYEEEWIPKHHLKSGKKEKTEGGAASGPESGAESEGAKKRRSSKRK